jgi:hypothetical protein
LNKTVDGSIIPRSAATKDVVNENTNYHTIAGSWISYPYFNFFYPLYDPKYPQSNWLPFERWSGDFIISGADDGIVPLWSAAPKGFKTLGVTNDCHTNLVDEEEEYAVVRAVLLESRQ